MLTPGEPSDESIRHILNLRARKSDYFLSVEDVAKHSDFLIMLVREKIKQLEIAMDGSDTAITIALNSVLMTPRWIAKKESNNVIGSDDRDET